MKILTVLSITMPLLIIYSFTGKQHKANDVISEKLKGKVTRITRVDYNAKQDSLGVHFLKLISKETRTYDRNGMIIETSRFSQEGKDDSIILRSFFRYDVKGKKINEEKYRSGDGLYGWCYFIYDNKDNLIEQDVCSINDSIGAKIISKYDANNNMIERDQCKKDGTVWDRYICKYDGKGTLIEAVSDYNWHSMKHTYKYDKRGDKIEERVFNADGSLYSEHTSKYDHSHNLIESNTHYAKNHANVTSIFKYDFDKVGNWITKMIFEDGTLNHITKRVIEYH